MKIIQESEDRIVIQYESDADISPEICVPTFSGDIFIDETNVSRNVYKRKFRLVNVLRGNNAIYGVYWIEDIAILTYRTLHT